MSGFLIYMCVTLPRNLTVPLCKISVAGKTENSKHVCFLAVPRLYSPHAKVIRGGILLSFLLAVELGTKAWTPGGRETLGPSWSCM